MDNLSRFYIDIATNANKMSVFNLASDAEKEKMLMAAGVENANEVLSRNEEELRKVLASALISSTGAWQGIETNAGNSDNRGNSPLHLRKQTH